MHPTAEPEADPTADPEVGMATAPVVVPLDGNEAAPGVDLVGRTIVPGVALVVDKVEAARAALVAMASTEFEPKAGPEPVLGDGATAPDVALVDGAETEAAPVVMTSAAVAHLVLALLKGMVPFCSPKSAM